MSISSSIATRIQSLAPGKPFLTSSFLVDWPRTAVDQTLSRMSRQGLITRLGRGIYIRSEDVPNDEKSRDTMVEEAVRLVVGNDARPTPHPEVAEELLAGNDPPTSLRHVYCTHSTARSFMVLGTRVRIRRLSARKFSNLGGRCAHALSALWNTEPHQRENKIMKILDRLTPDDVSKLRMAGNQLPDWANRGVREYAEQKTRPAKKRENPGRSIKHEDRKEWSMSTAEGRWSGFGPYYAMFPVEFARQVVERHCPAGGAVLDPFCGRGTVPFVALATGRTALGCDINPVAWIFAKTKTDPYPDPKRLMRRACEIQASITDADRTPANEFQELAWSQDVLGFLNSARRQLNWRQSQIDRTLMATLLVHLHSKLGEGLSNQMRQSKAMAPEYSVKWWKERAMLPPEIDVLEVLKEKLGWRYKKGIVSPGEGSQRPTIKLGDNRQALRRRGEPFFADLILTSPPYYGVTNYRYDNWIRLWMLGEGPALPASDAWARHQNQDEYRELIRKTFKRCKSKAVDGVVVYVRTDARQFTLQTTIDALREIWPSKDLYYAFDGFKKPTQTALFGDKGDKPGEVDLLILSPGQQPPKGMKRLAPGAYPKHTAGK